MGGEPLDTVTPRQVTVAFVEDQPCSIDGLRTWIENDPTRQLRLVATAGSLEEVLAGPGRDADILLLDLQLAHRPDVRAALPEIIVEVRKLLGEGRRVVIYSQENDTRIINSLRDAGVHAFLAKSEFAEFLIDTLVRVGQDRPALTRSMGGAILADKRIPDLSGRQREIMELWVTGMSKSSVGRRLDIRESTVDTHLERIYEKYTTCGRPVRSRTELAARAIEDGFIRPQDVQDYTSHAHLDDRA